MIVKFNFNDGTSKRLDKPLANQLEAKGMGVIDNGFIEVAQPKAEKAILSNKSDKVVQRRRTKKK